MGRFYKTSAVAPMDYMHSLDIPLMTKVIDANDQHIGDELNQAATIGDKAIYNHTAQDNEAAQAISDSYTNKVHDITRAIQSNPANWKSQLGAIDDLKQDLLTNYRTGDISKQIANYNRQQKAYTEADKQAELWHTSGGTKGVDPSYVSPFKNYWDKQFKGTKDPTTGQYNIYQGGAIPDTIDFHKVMSDGLDKMKAEKHSDITSTPDGKYWLIDQHGQKTEEISPERIIMAGLGNLTPSMISGLKQYQNVGIIDSNTNVDPNKAFSYDAVGINSQQQTTIDNFKKKIAATKNPTTKQSMQEQLDAQVSALSSKKQLNFANDNYFSPILKGLVGQYAYNNTEDEHKLSNWSMPGTMYTQGQENSRQGRQLGQAWQIHKDDLGQKIDVEKEKSRQFDERLDFDKYKWDNPHATGAKGLAGLKAPTTAQTIAGMPETTGVSTLGTRSFAGWMTNDKLTNKDVPVLSNAGLSNEIDDKKNIIQGISKRIGDIDNELKTAKDEGTIKNLTLERQQLQDKQKVVNSDLNARRKWYDASVDAVLNNSDKTGVKLDRNEVNTYNEFNDDRDGSKLQSSVNRLKSLWNDLNNNATELKSKDAVKNAEEIKRFTNEANIVKTSIEDLQNRKSDYINIKTKVDQGRNNWLKQLQNDVIDSDAIQLSGKDSQDVSQILFNHPESLQLFDADGNKLNGQQVTAPAKSSKYFGLLGADAYNMGTAGTNNLADYIHKYNVKVIPQMVGGSTNIGNGNGVVKVTFDDPNGKIPKGVPFYIEMNEGLQSDLAHRFSDTKKYGEGVAKIASDIQDPQLNDLKKQIIKPSLANAQGVNKDAVESTIKLYDPQGNTLHANVTRFNDGHLYVTYEDENGSVKPFPVFDPQTGQIDPTKQGQFQSIDDFNNQIKFQKGNVAKSSK